MRYSVTGVSRPLSKDEQWYIATCIKLLPAYPTEFHTGGAHGVDVWSAFMAAYIYNAAEHHIWVPQAKYDEDSVSVVEKVYPDIQVHEVSTIAPGTSQAYMARNDMLVEKCETLLAFPDTQLEVQRSGTWATVRRARSIGKTIILFSLDQVAPKKLVPGLTGWELYER